MAVTALAWFGTLSSAPLVMATAATQYLLQVLSAKSKRPKTHRLTSGLTSTFRAHTLSLDVPSTMATHAALSAFKPDQSTLQSPFTSKRLSTSSSHISQLLMLPVVVMAATRLPPPLEAKAMVATKLLLARATRLKVSKAINSPSTPATDSHNRDTSIRAQHPLLSISSKAQGKDMVLLAAATEEEQQPSSLL